MTVSTTIAVSGPYNGDGATVAFAFNFKLLAEGDLEVIETSAAGVETVKTLTTHYTVNAGPWPTGGTVTMLVAPAAGTTLTIRRKTTKTQTIDYITGGKFPAESHETGLDRVVMMVQDHDADLGRAIVVPKSEAIVAANFTLPSKTARANKYLYFDANGAVTIADGVAGGGLFVNKAGDTMTDALTISRTVSGATCLTLLVTENGSIGPKQVFKHTTTSPAANDVIGTEAYISTDSGGNAVEYVKLFGQIVDPADGSEDGQYVMQLMVAGALTTVYTFGPTGMTSIVPLIAPAATANIPSMRLPHGSAPSAPTNGDMWTTTAGLFVRINGATVGPLS